MMYKDQGRREEVEDLEVQVIEAREGKFEAD